MDTFGLLCILLWTITGNLATATGECNINIDPCMDGNNVALNDPSRSPTLQRPWNYTHDYNIETNWYRSTNWVGGEMPTGRVGSGRCSAVCPIWINGTLPNSPQEGIVDLNACATYLNVDCVRRYIIATKNCGDFNVYCLYPTQDMYDRFCMEYVENPDMPTSTPTSTSRSTPTATPASPQTSTQTSTPTSTSTTTTTTITSTLTSTPALPQTSTQTSTPTSTSASPQTSTQTSTPTSTPASPQNSTPTSTSTTTTTTITSTAASTTTTTSGQDSQHVSIISTTTSTANVGDPLSEEGNMDTVVIAVVVSVVALIITGVALAVGFCLGKARRAKETRAAYERNGKDNQQVVPGAFHSAPPTYEGFVKPKDVEAPLEYDKLNLNETPRYTTIPEESKPEDVYDEIPANLTVENEWTEYSELQDLSNN